MPLQAIEVQKHNLCAEPSLNARAYIICNRLLDRNVKTSDWLQMASGTEHSHLQEAGRPSSPKLFLPGKEQGQRRFATIKKGS